MIESLLKCSNVSVKSCESIHNLPPRAPHALNTTVADPMLFERLSLTLYTYCFFLILIFLNLEWSEGDLIRVEDASSIRLEDSGYVYSGTECLGVFEGIHLNSPYASATIDAYVGPGMYNVNYNMAPCKYIDQSSHKPSTWSLPSSHWCYS